MPRKKLILFISVFVIVGALAFGFYWYKNNKQEANQSTDSNYKSFGNGSSDTEEKSGDDTNTTNNQETEGEGSAVEETIKAKFTKITEYPIAGAVFFEDTRLIPEEDEAVSGGDNALNKKVVKKEPKFEVVPSLLFVEKITGHINQLYLDSGVEGVVSNTTIPSVYDALFDSKGSSLIYRYLSEDNKTITSFLAHLGGESSEFLSSNIVDISISPDGTRFFYIIKTRNGVVGNIRSFKESKKTQVWTSPMVEVLSQWAGDKKIYITTKASSGILGDIFSLNIATGTINKVFGGVKGLTTLTNKDGSLILYGQALSSGYEMGIFDVKNRSVIETGQIGLPEKCVWGETDIYCAVPSVEMASGYPDLWYQGVSSFNDSFIKINPKTGESVYIANSEQVTPVDATKLFLNKNNSKLFFINKKDGTLWSLDLD